MKNIPSVGVYIGFTYIYTQWYINALRNDIWRDNMSKKGGHRYVRNYTKKESAE